jgi:tetratricopeptide (TPR) repeat protein
VARPHFLQGLWLANARTGQAGLDHIACKEADKLFCNQEFEQASLEYKECLVINKDGNNSNQVDGLNAGGRLHAVLHCDLAACLMAQSLFQEAVEECTNALHIHSHYMKAILRRARCYDQMHQCMESISEYCLWHESGGKAIGNFAQCRLYLWWPKRCEG